VAILACSHLVVATENVRRALRFLELLGAGPPHFENGEFGEVVLPSRFRIAFFRVVGPAKKYFATDGERHHHSLGVTVADVEKAYAVLCDAEAVALGVQVSGPPKTHPWGEKSFLAIDPDGNRWEITQSPSKDGMLVNR
jgi:uncharacterized glyoxalase superfamily protein PhnB